MMRAEYYAPLFTSLISALAGCLLGYIMTSAVRVTHSEFVFNRDKVDFTDKNCNKRRITSLLTCLLVISVRQFNNQHCFQLFGIRFDAAYISDNLDPRDITKSFFLNRKKFEHHAADGDYLGMKLMPYGDITKSFFLNRKKFEHHAADGDYLGMKLMPYGQLKTIGASADTVGSNEAPTRGTP